MYVSWYMMMVLGIGLRHSVFRTSFTIPLHILWLLRCDRQSLVRDFSTRPESTLLGRRICELRITSSFPRCSFVFAPRMDTYQACLLSLCLSCFKIRVFVKENTGGRANAVDARVWHDRWSFGCLLQLCCRICLVALAIQRELESWERLTCTWNRILHSIFVSLFCTVDVFQVCFLVKNRFRNRKGSRRIVWHGYPRVSTRLRCKSLEWSLRFLVMYFRRYVRGSAQLP